MEGIPIEYSYGCQNILIEYSYGTKGLRPPQVMDPVDGIPVEYSYGCQCIPIEQYDNTLMIPKGCPRPSYGRVFL